MGLEEALSLIEGLIVLTGTFSGGSLLLESEEKRALLVGMLLRDEQIGSFGSSWPA
jgi:hypothetical protein